MKHLRSSSLAVIALSLASPIAAMEAPGDNDREQQAEIVVNGVRVREGYVPVDTNAAKIPAELKDIPQSIAVVPAEVLRDQRALSLQDALRNVPGIGLSHGDGQRDQVFIRGFTAIGDQYVDGFRDDGLYFRDLSNVDRVEVVKGPAAVLYGRGSSGGLINRITKKPGIDIASVTLSAGSFDSYRGEFDLGTANAGSGIGFRMTGAVEDGDSFRSQQFLKRTALAPSFLIGGSGDTTLLVQADYLKDRRLTDFGIPAIDGRPVAVPRSRYYGAANARQADVSQAEVLSQTATLTHRFSDSISFRNGFRHYRYTLDRRNTNSTAVNPVARTVTLSHGGIDRDEDGWSNQAELTQKIETFGVRHTLLYGWEEARQVKDAVTLTSRPVATTPILSPVLPVIDPNAFFPARVGNTVSRNHFDTTGLYVQDLIDFGIVKALIGLRHDRFEQRTTQRVLGQPTVLNLARTDKTWSPRAGVVIQPDQQQSYYASWSRSFQPSAETFALAANNVDIAPERTTNKEVGAKYTLLDNRLAIQLAAYDLKRVGIKGTDPATNRIVPIGTQRTRGIELSATLDMLAGFRAIAGYSYMDAKVIASANPNFVGNGATLTPEHQANLFVTKTIAERFGIGGGVNYVGDRWADPANTVTLPGYVVGDAMGWAEFGPVRLQVNVQNVTDRNYIISGHGTSAILNLPGGPRTVLGTVRVAF